MLNMSLRDSICAESKDDNIESHVVISDTENDDVIFVAVIRSESRKRTANRRKITIKQATPEEDVIDLTSAESAEKNGISKSVDRQETYENSPTEQADDTVANDDDNKHRGNMVASDDSQKKSDDDPVIPFSVSSPSFITLPKLHPLEDVGHATEKVSLPFGQTPMFDELIKYPSLDNNGSIPDTEKLKTSTTSVNNTTPNLLTGLPQQQADSSHDSGRSAKCRRLDDAPENSAAIDLYSSSVDAVDNSNFYFEECSICKDIYDRSLVLRCQCGQYSCFKCIENQVTELLSSGRKELPECGSTNCKNTFSIDTIAGFMPPMVVNILKSKIDKEKIRDIELWLKPEKEYKHLFDLPEHWKVMTDNQEYQLVPLSPESSEFMDIESLFHQTMFSPRARIQSIKRVQNASLWRFYAMKRDIMRTKSKLSPEQPLERRLFHGTNENNVHSICTDNFDWRLSGVHGTALGVGSYFARDASYSHKYTDRPPVRLGSLCGTNDSRLLAGHYTRVPITHITTDTIVACHHRVMFVAKVLTGLYTEGKSEYRKPPPLISSGTVSYDSCVDNCINPRIFVVFEKFQCYPEYIIEYSNQYRYRLQLSDR